MILDLSVLEYAYDYIRKAALGNGTSILILCAGDADSLCSLKILSTLLRTDNMRYKVVAVSGYEDVKRAHDEHIVDNDELRTIILINCGAIVDLSNFMDLGSDMGVYVVDSHRPYNLRNVHSSNESVRVIDDNEEVQEYPSDIDEEDSEDEELEGAKNDEESVLDGESGREEDDEDDDEASVERKRKRKQKILLDGDISDGDDDPEEGDDVVSGAEGENDSTQLPGNSRGSRRRKTGDDSYARIRSREEKKIKMREIEQYYEGSYYGRPSSYVLYRMAKSIGKYSKDLLWYAILGLTEHLLLDRINPENYNMLVAELASDVSDLVTRQDVDVSVDGVFLNQADDGHITMEDEFRFFLFRHWNLYDSMYHSPYVATRLKLWQQTGPKQLRLWLAKMGLPLEECRAPYKFMSSQVKSILRDRMEKYLPKFGLQDVVYQSFCRQIGSTTMSSSDVVFCIMAMLESPPAEVSESEDEELASQSWQANFWKTYSSIDQLSTDAIEEKVQMAIKMQKLIVQQGSSLIQKGNVMSLGPFRYCILDEPLDKHLFNHPLALTKLACFLRSAFVEMKGTPKPFMAASLNKTRGTYMVVGVGSSNDDMSHLTGSSSNKFGVAFRKTAILTNARIKHDGFEMSIMEIQRDDMNRFVEILHSGYVSL